VPPGDQVAASNLDWRIDFAAMCCGQVLHLVITQIHI
jgi:hypothetical protein